MVNKLEDFERGMKVTLDKNSQFYRINSPNNPQGIVGKVVLVRKCGKYVIDVGWCNGRWNSYEPTDLKILGVVVDES
ncbi:hypothetical protein Mithridates_00017 [Acinetobacter phage Mithridates]|nr:hypothetical protein Mithridates_00017 [Acinetobacter phage Mithridates]